MRFKRFAVLLLLTSFITTGAQPGFDPKHVPADHSAVYAGLSLKLTHQLKIPAAGIHVQKDSKILGGRGLNPMLPYCHLRFGRVINDQNPRATYEFIDSDFAGDFAFKPTDSQNAFARKMSSLLRAQDSTVLDPNKEGFRGLFLQCTHVSSIADVQKILATIGEVEIESK